MVVLIKELATTLEKQRTGTTVTCGWVVSYAYRGSFIHCILQTSMPRSKLNYLIVAIALSIMTVQCNIIDSMMQKIVFAAVHVWLYYNMYVYSTTP